MRAAHRTHKKGELARLPQLAEFRYQLRRFLNFSETAAEQMGVPAQQYQLLQVIGALPKGQSASISHLAERMVLRHNSTVELVDRAERAGLVQRASDERDLRRSLVVLTAAGQDVLKQLIVAHLEQLDGAAGACLLQVLRDVRNKAASTKTRQERTSQERTPQERAPLERTRLERTKGMT